MRTRTVGYRHLLGVQAPKACFKALLYYRPVAERVVAEAQKVVGSSGTFEPGGRLTGRGTLQKKKKRKKKNDLDPKVPRTPSG